MVNQLHDHFVYFFCFSKENLYKWFLTQIFILSWFFKSLECEHSLIRIFQPLLIQHKFTALYSSQDPACSHQSLPINPNIPLHFTSYNSYLTSNKFLRENIRTQVKCISHFLTKVMLFSIFTLYNWCILYTQELPCRFYIILPQLLNAVP